METDEISLKETHTYTSNIGKHTTRLHNCLLRLFYSENHVAAPIFTVKIGNSHLLTTSPQFDTGKEIKREKSQ